MARSILALLVAMLACASAVVLASDPAVTHKVFFDIEIDGKPSGRIVMGLFSLTRGWVVMRLFGLTRRWVIVRLLGLTWWWIVVRLLGLAWRWTRRVSILVRKCSNI